MDAGPLVRPSAYARPPRARGRPVLGGRTLRRARSALPGGLALPANTWRRQHRAILALLWLHVALLPCFSLLMGHGLAHGLLDAGAVGFFAVVAAWSRPGRRGARWPPASAS